MLSLHTPLCISNRICSRLCSSRDCPHDPVICLEPKCRCIRNHANCQNLIYWDQLAEHCERNQEQNSTQYVNYVHYTLDNLLIEFIGLLQQQLSRFRYQKLCIGLSEKYKEFIRRIRGREKLSTSLIADIVFEEERGIKVVEYPIAEHQHSVKVIKHTITNLISMFRQAFSFKTVEEERQGRSFEVSRVLDFSRIEPESHKRMKQSDMLGFYNENKNPTRFVNLEDFGLVNKLSLKACSAQQLSIAAELFKEVEILDLQDCGINLEGVKALQGFRKVQRLNLHKNRIQDDGLINLSKQFPQLMALGLRDTGISDRGLISMSSNLPQLIELYLSDNKIQKEGIEILGKNCKSILTLFLCNNKLKDEVVCTLLNDLPNLQVLSLKNNGIHDDTIILLCQRFPRLFALYAGENNLTDKCCEALARLQSIQTLFLCNNKLTETGVDMILKSVTTLQYLGIRNNNIDETHRKRLSKHQKYKIIT